MSKEEKPRIMIDRYGSPLGTPPEIYRDCIENNKNEINHGNIQNPNIEETDEKKEQKNIYYENDNAFYDENQKTDGQINFNQNNNFSEYETMQQQQHETDYDNMNMGITYQKLPFNQDQKSFANNEYDFNKQPIYVNQRDYYNDDRYDYSNARLKQQQQQQQQPVPPINMQDPVQFYDNYNYLDLPENHGLININDGRMMNLNGNYFEAGTNELPVYVNIKQFHCIRKRKMRRDYLDTLMKQSNTPGYLHESRHRHAMNRIRAPSGRFLTKKETAELLKKRENQ